MSSETSTDTLIPHGAGVRDGDPGLPPHRAGVHGGDPGLEPWQLFTLAGLIGATVVVFVSRGQTPAGIVLLSLTIFTAAIAGVAAWRTLAPFTGSDERVGSPVLGGRTRAALEREKTLVLRSIKELEFDRAMRKVSEKDSAEIGARLRGRATRLMGQLDAGVGYRHEIEKEIARRVRTGSKKQDPAHVESEVGRVPRSGPAAYACPACGKDRDVDARFCKHCGANLEAMR